MERGMPTIDEALAALAEAIGTDDAHVKEAARALRNQIPALGQNILNAGAALKKNELNNEITRLTDELAAAKTLNEETTRDFDTFKAKTPDIAAVEAQAKAKWQPKLDALAAELADAKGLVVSTTRDGMIAKLVTELVSKHGVQRQWAERVVAAEHSDRIVANPDKTWKVLQLGSEDAYDVTSQEEALSKLAADAAKTVPAQFVTTTVRTGGGTGGDRGGSNRSEVDLTNEKRDKIPRQF